MDPAQARAVRALERALYLLDRSFAPSHKTRAFSTAMQVIARLDDGELERLVHADSVTTLSGIGASTGSVITDAVLGRQGGYLSDLDARTAIDPGDGAALRAQLRGDCHSHTVWSDGGASSAQMALAARELGHEYLVITDHSPRLTIAHGLSPQRLAEQRLELDTINDQLASAPGDTGFRLLHGNEVDITEDGSLDLEDSVLSTLDIVVASVHSKLRMDNAAMTQRLIAAVTNPHVNILGHCTGRQIIGTPRPPSNFDARAVFDACAASNTAVEINCRPERQDPPDELLAIALEAGCLVAINTDAHAPGQLEWQASGCIKASAHRIDPTRIINTYSLDALRSWAS